MRHPRRTVTVSLLTTALFGAALAAGVSNAVPPLTESAPAPHPPRIAWKPCPSSGTGEKQKPAQCARVRVPLDWAEPHGEQIQIAVARRPATHPARRIGTLVYLPGGPGTSGVDTLEATAEFGGLEQRFDIVSLDPRGVGGSTPLTCPTDEVRQAAPTTIPTTDAALARLRKANRRLAADCRKATGKVFDHLGSASAARDLDVVRQALGDSKVSLYAHSYGTYLAQEYAARFGDHLRAGVLDGTMDRTARRRHFTRTAAEAFDASFGQFARWCTEHTSCAVHGEDADEVFRRVRGKAARGELGDDGSGLPWTAYTFTSTVDAMLFTPSWDALATFLHTLDSGKPWQTTPGDGEDTGPTVNYASPIVCQDYAFEYRDAEAVKADLRATRAPVVGYSPNAMTTVLGCQGWPVRHAPGRPAPARNTSGNPLLLVQSRYDNATPAAWARTAARQLGAGKASLAMFEDWTHGMKVFNTGCEADTVHAYLEALRLPRPGTRCGGAGS